MTNRDVRKILLLHFVQNDRVNPKGKDRKNLTNKGKRSIYIIESLKRIVINYE
ncbi:MAG: hypothetical protein WC614_06295 [bacterium]